MMCTDEEYFVIDTDCGSDDALAIMLAVNYIQNNKNCKRKLAAIVCCPGNTTVDKVARNVLLTLNIMNETNVKVYKASHCSLLKKYESYEYFGEDGLGNCVSCYEAVDSKVEDENGIQALIELVKKYPKRVTILCLGPLTNLALAYLLDQKFFENTKQLYILGGNINALGNVTPVAEFNFYFDPESVDIILTNAVCPVTIIPWETCQNHCLRWDFYKKITEIETKKAIFVKRITTLIAGKSASQNEEGFAFADFLVAAAYLNPKLILESKKWSAKIELKGDLCRGQLVVDKRAEDAEEAGVTFVTRIDETIVNDMFESMVL